MSKFFSKSFYFDTILRLRGIIIFSLVYFTIMSASAPSSFLLQLIEHDGVIGGISYVLLYSYDVLSPLVAFVTICVPIMTMIAFSFLYKRNTADFFEHLPYTRLSMSISSLLAILTVACAVITVSSLFSSLLLIPSVSAGIVRYDFASGIFYAMAMLITSLYTMAATFVGVSVTGTFIGTSIVTLSIIALPRAIMSTTTSLLETLAPTLVSGHVIPIFNNSYNLATTLFANKFFVLGTPTAYIYTLVLGAALLALGFWLYQKRKSESATRMFASRTALECVRTAVTVALVLSAISGVCSGVFALAVALLGIALLVHFAFGRTLGRESGGAKRALVTFAIGVGCAAVIFTSVLIASFVANSYSPEADEISYISHARELADGQSYINYSDYVDIQVSDIKIEDAEIRKLVAEALDRGVPKNHFDYKAVPVKIKSGAFEKYRTLYLTVEECAVLNSSYAELDEYKEIWLSVGDGAYNPYIYVNGEEMEQSKVGEILEKYQSEVRALGFDAYCSIYYSKWSEYTLCYSVSFGGRELIVNLPICEELAETFELTKKYAKEIEERRYNELISRLDDAVTSEKIQYLSLDYYTEQDIYSAYIELGTHNSESLEIVRRVKESISSEMSYDKSGVMYVSIWTDDISDLGSYGSFVIKDGVDEDELISFLKKYGN